MKITNKDSGVAMQLIDNSTSRMSFNKETKLF